MSLQVKYMDVPEGAQDVAITGDELQPFSYTQQLATGAEDIPWATLEQSGWVLDGSRKLLSQNPDLMGWWSGEVSDDQGIFANPQTITATFFQPITATGLTFQFWPSAEQWCSKIRVTWYRDDVLLEQADTDPTAAQWVFYHPVENFNKVEVCLLQTNRPGQFAKLQMLQIGRVMVFMGDELVTVQMLNETDPSLCALPVDTMTLKLRDRKGRFLQPQKDQQVQLYRDGVLLATQYITDAQRESKENYRLRSQSVIGRLEDTYLGGVYQDYPMEFVLQEVLDGYLFRVDKAFEEQSLTGYLPVCTRRQALQQIAFALGAEVTTLPDGTIWLKKPEETVSGAFTADKIFNGSKLKQESPVEAVELFVHSYVHAEEDKFLLKETEVVGEDVLFVFSEPHYDYDLTGGVLTGSDANWVRITANGQVTLRAKGYRHTVSVWRKENPKAGGKGNMVAVEKATLIHTGNADAALQRLYDYYTVRDLLIQDVVVDEQKVGQIVESRSPWDSQVMGHIIGMESTFTDTGHVANVQIRGREVQVS